MTPGSYIRKRRQARGLTHLDVCQASDNFVVNDLREIEQDKTRPKSSQCGELAINIGFPVEILQAIINKQEPRVCRKCACSEHDPCVDEHDVPCHWVEADLCSACADPVEEEDERAAA